MYKINYNQHDWNKGEVIKEENLDNMENGIKQATNKINEIIDTEQDFKDRMADIDRRIDINNEELVVARDGCDNLGQRIERDQQYIYNILNDGSYLEFNGTDITVDNSKEGYTSNMVIKGQTYQNLAPKVTKYLHNAKSDNDGKFTIIEQTSTSIVLQINSELTSWSYINCGKVDINMLKANTVYTFCGDFENIVSIKVQSGDGLYVACDSVGTTDNKFRIRTKDADTLNSIPKNSDLVIYVTYNKSEGFIGKVTCKNVVLLEGDWLNKEVPSSIDGIESVGDKENNKISILSRSKNLFNYKDSKEQAFIKNNGAIIKHDLWRVSDYIDCKMLSNLFLSGLTVYPNTNSNNFLFYDKNKNVIRSLSNPNFKTVALEGDEYYIRFSYKVVDEKTVQLEEGTQATPYVPYKEDKKEILISLDGGLKSLPNGVADTIEQREDGVYLVQRIGKKILNGTENYKFKNDITNDNIITFTLGGTDGKPNGTNKSFLCDKFVNKPNYTDLVEGCWCDCNFMFTINKSKLVSADFNGFKQWLQDNPTTVYYELNTPIETKLDIDTLNLETFKDLTYVLSDNNIAPVFDFKAPVDINQTIADLQEEQEQLIETYNTLKEENEAVKTAVSELNEQEDVQTADMLDLDMRVLALEEGLE